MDLIVISEVINSTRTMSNKFGWSGLIFFFPVFGAFLYLLFGNRENYNSRVRLVDEV